MACSAPFEFHEDFRSNQQEASMASTIGDFLDFNGKEALITGAATGIGRAVAVGFAGDQ